MGTSRLLIIMHGSTMPAMHNPHTTSRTAQTFIAMWLK